MRCPRWAYASPTRGMDSGASQMATLSRASKMAWCVSIFLQAHAYERPSSVSCWTRTSVEAVGCVFEDVSAQPV